MRISIEIIRNNCILILLVLCNTVIFAQDKKVMKIAKYIEKGKGTEAKELLDELDSKKEYQSDIYYWYVRTVYYRNVALANTNSTTELAEARKSFEKLVQLDKADQSKSLSQYIPQFKKDLNEGREEKINNSDNSGQSITKHELEDKINIVTIVVLGQGTTIDEAKNNALRSAIEQAYGAYISSNTTILNDNLINEKIVSIANGNIQKFDIINEEKLPNGIYTVTLNTTVSINKLSSFCESKGVKTEFNGSLFSFNIKQIILNESSEILAINNLISTVYDILLQSFDYSILTTDPKAIDDANKKWKITVYISVRPNKNLELAKKVMQNTLSGLSMKQGEMGNYLSLNKKINDYYFLSAYHLRTRQSITSLYSDLQDHWHGFLRHFQVDNGFSRWNGFDLLNPLST